MLKVATLTLALVSVVLAGTSFVEVPIGSKPKFVGDLVSHGKSYSARSLESNMIPPDDGGNWGDNFWGVRDNTTLITREIQVNIIIPNTDQQFNWDANYPNQKIRHIRFINLGHQRAFVDTLSANEKGGPVASAVIRIPKNEQCRLLIEVYGD